MLGSRLRFYLLLGVQIVQEILIVLELVKRVVQGASTHSIRDTVIPYIHVINKLFVVLLEVSTNVEQILTLLFPEDY